MVSETAPVSGQLDWSEEVGSVGERSSEAVSMGLTLNGALLVDWQHAPILAYHNLPLTLANNVEAFRIARWMVQNSGINLDDILARMPFKPGTNEPCYPTTRALKTRVWRWDPQTGAASNDTLSQKNPAKGKRSNAEGGKQRRTMKLLAGQILERETHGEVVKGGVDENKSGDTEANEDGFESGLPDSRIAVPSTIQEEEAIYQALKPTRRHYKKLVASMDVRLDGRTELINRPRPTVTSAQRSYMEQWLSIQNQYQKAICKFHLELEKGEYTVIIPPDLPGRLYILDKLHHGILAWERAKLLTTSSLLPQSMQEDESTQGDDSTQENDSTH